MRCSSRLFRNPAPRLRNLPPAATWSASASAKASARARVARTARPQTYRRTPASWRLAARRAAGWRSTATGFTYPRPPRARAGGEERRGHTTGSIVLEEAPPARVVRQPVGQFVPVEGVQRCIRTVGDVHPVRYAEVGPDEAEQRSFSAPGGNGLRSHSQASASLRGTKLAPDQPECLAGLIAPARQFAAQDMIGARRQDLPAQVP